MDIYRVSLIGHRHMVDSLEVERKLIDVISHLLDTQEFVEFQLGREGDFDISAASCIKQVQKIKGNQNSALTLVLPYRKADIEYYEAYYDSILIPEEAEQAHFKAAITVRNRWLAMHADLLIAHVLHAHGGAFACLTIAEKRGVPIFYV